MNGILWLWLAYRAFDFVYVMSILNVCLFLFTGYVSIIVPVATLIVVGLERYLNALLIYHGIDGDNLDDLL